MMVARERTVGQKGRVKLRDKAYESFTQNLLDSRIRPGQFLSQRQLVAVTGLPLGAIRELIPRLEAHRLIETVPQRGMQVASVDLKLVRNVFQLWMILAKAGAAHFVQVASDADIQALADAHAEILVRARKKSDQKLLEEAKRFEWKLHDTFIDAFENEMLSDVYRINRIKVELIRMERGKQDDPAILSSIQDYLAIIQALKARDSERVVAAVDAHLDAAHRRAMGL
jgi:DNA-binding GntR family transcriptional regulator